MKRLIILIVLFCVTMASPALAQRKPDKNAGRVYQLKITPMLPPRPAMKYRLLPTSADTTAGNAAPLYMMGATQAPTDDAFNTQIDSWLNMDMAQLPRQEI